MITTSREVDTERGTVSYTTRSVKRISPEEKIISINPDVEIKPFSEAAASPVAVEKTVFMPTIENEQTAVPEKKEEQKLSSRAKIMLYVYMATAVILAMIVMITGLAIGRASKEVVSLENTLSAQSQVLTAQNETIAYLGDEATIAEKASELGMTVTSGATAIDLIELVSAPEYSAKTNAFDKFCDFLGGIIG